jgi:hypothetical protein
MGIYGADASTLHEAQYSQIMGGNNNQIRNGINNGILFGTYNTISGSTDTAEILGSDYCSVIGGADRSTIIASSGSTVNAGSARVMIATEGQTALYNNTTHTDNIHTYKTETFNVIDAGNVGGSINVDCSLGTIFTFALTANTTPNFINIKTGQRFIFIVENTGSFTVPTATVGGVSSTVFAEGGALNPTNNGFTKYQAVYAGGILWINEELNYQAV